MFRSVIGYQSNAQYLCGCKKMQSPKAYLGVFLMPFDCVGVEMHIEGHILEICCRFCQNKEGRCFLEAGRGKRQVNLLKKSF